MECPGFRHGQTPVLKSSTQLSSEPVEKGSDLLRCPGLAPGCFTVVSTSHAASLWGKASDAPDLLRGASRSVAWRNQREGPRSKSGASNGREKARVETSVTD